MRSWANRRRDERGIIAIFVSLVTCFTLIPIAAFAVDIGVQRVARRDMQALADVVALDLGRELDGRTYSQLQPHLQALADKSAARNSSIGRARAVRAELGVVDESKYTPADPGAIFTPITPDAGGIPNAIRVSATTTVDFAIHGGSGSAVRTAIARADSSACFAVGSYALNLDSSKSLLLNWLINDALNLSAISYTGLANANISLHRLALAMGLGTTDELLKLKNVSLNSLFSASATALSQDGGEAADVTLLNQLASASFSGLAHIDFSDLVSIDSGSGSALATSLNVLDLVAGSAFLANGTNALSIPSITAGVPNVGSVTASLHVIQAPVVKCGHVGTQVSTSQITLDVNSTLTNVGLLGMTASSTASFHVDVAKATGTLTKIVCGNPEGIDVSVASSLSQLASSLDTDLKLLSVVVAHVDGDVGTLAPAATSTVSIRIPPNSYGQPVSSGSGVVVPQMASGNLSGHVLGTLPLGVTGSSILTSVYSSIVTPTLNPLTTNLNSIVNGPLSKLLGTEFGGADVFAVQKPSCNEVALVG
jgi:uncharacterized membrane protein